MSGVYPWRYGFQYGVLRPDVAHGLPPKMKILPQYLSDLGYVNFLAGKWHLGYCNNAFLPTRRGFHSFFGFLTGCQDYYTSESLPSFNKCLELSNFNRRKKNGCL